MFYLGSVAGAMLVNLWSGLVTHKRLKDLGYIEKMFKKRFSLANLIQLICIFTPGLNIAVSAFLAFATIKSMNDDDLVLAMYHTRCYSSESVKKRYERDNVQEDVLRDAMTLDGADEELIQEQIKKIEQQKLGYEENYESRSVLLRPVPDFTDEEYLWACAEEYAKSVVDAIALDADLTYEQYEEILNLFRKECKAELTGKEQSGEKVMQKVLNIVEQ